jgi:hypothetical protein
VTQHAAATGLERAFARIRELGESTFDDSAQGAHVPLHGLGVGASSRAACRATLATRGVGLRSLGRSEGSLGGSPSEINAAVSVRSRLRLKEDARLSRLDSTTARRDTEFACGSSI